MSKANFQNLNSSCVFSYKLGDEFDHEELIADIYEKAV